MLPLVLKDCRFVVFDFQNKMIYGQLHLKRGRHRLLSIHDVLKFKSLSSAVLKNSKKRFSLDTSIQATSPFTDSI